MAAEFGSAEEASRRDQESMLIWQRLIVTRYRYLVKQIAQDSQELFSGY